jgi:hypothetical protein
MKLFGLELDAVPELGHCGREALQFRRHVDSFEYFGMPFEMLEA